MKDFEVIIKDKTGKEIESDVQTLDIDKNKVYLVSLIAGDMDKECAIMQARFLKEKLNEYGVDNVLVVPVKDREHIIDIKEIKLD